jgi:pimeloyl-ACP methyl ester carboxylesterase
VTAVAVTREGAGPEVLLVHGGASARRTWGALAPLAARWTLAFVHRRGYPPSPPEPGGVHDFDVDADDLAALLAGRPHLVAHSYGALGTLLAAQRAPGSVRSLTIVEPPLAHLVRGGPDVAEFERIGDEVLTRGLDTEPEDLRTFLRVSGAGEFGPGPLPENVARAVRRAQGGRLPREAHPRLDVLRDAGIPALVASGGHSPGIERICDVVAEGLGARRLIAPGAGHFVAAAPGFADELERFLAAQSRTATRSSAR